MLDVMDTLKVLGRNDEEDSTLVKIETDDLNTVALIWHMGDDENEEVYVLTDMQGYYPEDIEDVEEFDWIRIEDLVEEQARLYGWK